MNATHTPTPWRLVPGTRIIKQDCTCIGLSTEAGVQIGSAAGYPNSGFFPTDEEGNANAEFIVLACNAHAKLVDALQMAKHVIANDGTQEQLDEIFTALESAGVKP